MCKLCLEDGNTQRHTVPPIPGAEYGPRGPRRPPPGPVQHGTLRGVRWHRALRWGHAEKELCDACSAFESSPAYLRAVRRDALDNVIRRLDPDEGIQDPELRAFYERKRARLEKQLSGQDSEPAPRKRQRSAEPMELMHVRVPVRMIDALKERAEEEETSVSELTRQALDAFLLL